MRLTYEVSHERWPLAFFLRLSICLEPTAHKHAPPILGMLVRGITLVAELRSQGARQFTHGRGGLAVLDCNLSSREGRVAHTSL